jgi:hypothetical protein
MLRRLRTLIRLIGPIPLLIIAAAVIVTILFIWFFRYIAEKKLERDVKRIESEILGHKTTDHPNE